MPLGSRPQGTKHFADLNKTTYQHIHLVQPFALARSTCYGVIEFNRFIYNILETRATDLYTQNTGHDINTLISSTFNIKLNVQSGAYNCVSLSPLWPHVRVYMSIETVDLY